ncbi:MAG: hypothetical protein HDQ89_04925 [Desulfovibrio sp.]|nr:hypothetical protein [Desulfovibrio sp.]
MRKGLLVWDMLPPFFLLWAFMPPGRPVPALTEIRCIVAKEAEKCGPKKGRNLRKVVSFCNYSLKIREKKFFVSPGRDFLHFFRLTRREPAPGKGMAGAEVASAKKVVKKYSAKSVC